MNILVLTRYSRLGASSRLRFLQFLPKLEQYGISFTIEPLLDDSYLAALYSGSRLPLRSIALSYLKRLRGIFSSKHYDLIWLEKEAFPWLPSLFETAALSRTPYMVDFDDAWFHRYDNNSNPLVRFALGRKLDHIMKHAAVVISGNAYISNRARQCGAARVLELPTVVNLDDYRADDSTSQLSGQPLVLVWIGTPVTAPYLELIAPVLRELGRDCTLRLVGAGPFQLSGINIEHIPWSEATEASALLGSHVGIMPLHDGPWEQGKSGFKIIQYMAADLPVVASPVGAACEIVIQGTTGFLPRRLEDWTTALRSLADEPQQARLMGHAGRQRCAELYSVDAVLPKLVDALKSAIRE